MPAVQAATRASPLHQWAAALLLLCALAAPAAAETVVIATTPSVLSLPLDVALAQGHFKAERVDVRLLECSGGPRCMQLLFDGSAQLVASSELPVVFSSFERNDFAVIATMTTSTRNIRLIGRKSAGVTAPQQLAGKRIGVIVGSSSHYFLDAYLLFHGIDPRRIKLVPLLPEQIGKAITSGQVDALAGYSRHTVAALAALGADGLVLPDPRIYTETYNLVATRRALAQAGPDIVRVLRALARAERFIAEQPQQAKALMQARTRLGAGFIDELFPGMHYGLGLNQSLLGTMEGVARWSVREGHVPPGSKIPNYLDFVESVPLRAAVPAAVQH